jgi:phenylpyruvate tautomerase PptA (4-oxalocrotonate tautomerase family)|tara:strand:- start:63 stop:467 length:405 start_codon:yes stop_codon:yes gene_type:complete
MLNLTSLIAPVSGLLDKFIEDKDKKNALAHEIATMAQKHAQENAKAQIEVNKEEAKHNNLFVSGWRPACGWVAVIGMASNFMVIPLANFILAVLESTIVVPVLNTSEMMPLLIGMLGLGTMRTAEKYKGVQRDK